MWLILILFLAVQSSAALANKRSWTYEPLSVEVFTTDEKKLSLGLQIVRISRGVFAVSGEIVWNYDIGPDTTVEYLSYRSATGRDDDYKLLPFSIPKQHFYDYLNSFYRDVSRKNLGNCTNLPQFEGKFKPPWEKKTYTFNRCEVTGEGMPQYMPEGYYKIIGMHYGEVEWSVTFIAKVTAKVL